MARPSTGANLNIAQLEQILNERKNMISRLHKQRKEAQRKLDAIDWEIEKIGGAPGSRGPRTGPGSRARNAMSLPEVLDQVLRANNKPMKVGDITEAVLATGYRSNSDKFRAIVNQTLIKERKRFVGTGERGTYAIKK
jgi:septal ring factor EnvC (AmiA/AmiB activator)